MPSKSKKQQRLFGMIHACKKYNKCADEDIKRMAKKIKDGDAKDLAKTSHNNLPEKVKKENRYSFKVWCESKKGEKMSNKECKCECDPCKTGDCQACDCENCKCENCTCC
jgi:hypothetical protein